MSPAGGELQRRLGLPSLTSLVVANMIGVGIFTTSGLILGQVHDPRLLLALWLLGGVIALCGALSYGELAAAMPRAGGEYVFLSRLGHPLLGFLSGWVSLFAGFSAPIAAAAIACTAYLARAFPGLLAGGAAADAAEGATTGVVPRLLAVLLIGVFTAIHRRGLELGSRVQNALTLLKLALILGLVAAGFALGSGDLGHLTPGGTTPAPAPSGWSGWQAAGLSLMWILFAYSGWNAAAYLGSEARDPGRTLPRSLLLGTALVTALYLALNLLFVYAADPRELAGEVAVGSLAVGNLFGPGWERALSLMISLALLSSLSAAVILGPRVYHAMAADGLFLGFAREVHPRFGVPSRSVLLQGGLAAMMAAAGTFDQILTFMGFALGIFPLLAVLAVYRLRRRVGRPPGAAALLAPPVFVLTSAAILVLAFRERPVESLVALVTVALGVPAYALLRRRRSGPGHGGS